MNEEAVPLPLLDKRDKLIRSVVQLLTLIKENGSNDLDEIVSSIAHLAPFIKEFKILIDSLARPYFLYLDKVQTMLGRIEHTLKTLAKAFYSTYLSDEGVIQRFSDLYKQINIDIHHIIYWFKSSKESYLLDEYDDFTPSQEVDVDMLVAEYRKIPKWYIFLLHDAQSNYVNKCREFDNINEQINLKADEKEISLIEKIKDLEISLRERETTLESNQKYIALLLNEKLEAENEIKYHKIVLEQEIELREEQEKDHYNEILIKEEKLSVMRIKVHSFFQDMKDKLASKDEEVRYLSNKVKELENLERRSHISDISSNGDDHIVKESVSEDSIEEVLKELKSQDYDITLSECKSWLGGKNIRELLCGMLFEPSFRVMDLLSSCTSGPPSEKLVTQIVLMYEERGAIMPLIRSMISAEIERTSNLSTLFRNENFPSRILRIYTRIIGKDFVRASIGSLIQEVIDLDLYLEIDPIKNMGDEPIPYNLNLVELRTLAQRFFNRITESVSYIPIQLLQITSFLVSETSSKFGDDPHIIQVVVAGFIFLRFFNPCLTAPEGFGLPELSPKQGRTMMLIAKMLQNLANGSGFREPYYSGMDFFLEKNRIRLQKFVTQLSYDPPFTRGGSQHLIESERVIHQFLDRIFIVLEKPEFADVKNAHWISNIEVNLMKRFKVLIDFFNKNNLDETEIHEFDKDTGDLVKLCIHHEDFINSITFVVKNHKLKHEKITQVSDSMVVVFHENDCIDQLYDMIMKQELMNEGGNNEETGKMPEDSFLKYIYNSYCRVYCSSWLNSFIYDIIDIIPLDELVNTEVALNLTVPIVLKFLENLPQSPYPIWSLSRKMAEYFPESVFIFITQNYLCELLQNPGLYIEDFVPTIVLTENMKILAKSISNHVINNGEKYFDSLSDWWTTYQYRKTVLETRLDFADMKNIFQLFIAWLKEYYQYISKKLSTITCIKNIKFNTEELLSILEPKEDLEDTDIVRSLDIVDDESDEKNISKKKRSRKSLSKVKKLAKSEKKRKGSNNDENL